MGQPRPVSRRRAPVRLAIRSGTCCRHASTASTANSGIVCSHARMASATPCAMKNCADSAAQAISMEAARIEGAVQSTELAGASGMAVTVSRSSAHSGANLAERDTGVLLDHGMLCKPGALIGVVEAVVGAAALAACQGAARDEELDGGSGFV